jgi:hypothetical protein
MQSVEDARLATLELRAESTEELTPDRAIELLEDRRNGITIEDLRRGVLAAFEPAKGLRRGRGPVTVDDFRCLMTMNKFIYEPSGDLWPASSVNHRLPPVAVVNPDGSPKLNKQGEPIYEPASAWIAEHRPVEQMTWSPGDGKLIRDKLIAMEGGWIEHQGARAFNLYTPPTIRLGDAAKATPWIEHLERVYPEHAEHLTAWFSHRVQRPGEKVNHGVVLGGAPGIGKDTLLAPIREAVGPWNFNDVSPIQLLGSFNGFLQSVVLRVSEARDMGEQNRYQLYEHCKTLLAQPPEVLRIDRKHLAEYAIPNVVGLIFTTNRPTEAFYLPADDRRHYVATSEAKQGDFDADHWRRFWHWYVEEGGLGHVAAYLHGVDLDDWDPFAPPPKTDAFKAIVDASRAPEDSDMADALDALGWPDVLTLDAVEQATADAGFQDWLRERRNRRQIPHRFAGAGYAPVRNDAAKDGLFKIQGRRQALYGREQLTVAERLGAARKLINSERSSWPARSVE